MEELNRAGISADSELRKTENMFFPKHIREISTEDPLSTALPLPPPEQPLGIQGPPLGVEFAVRVEKGKEVHPTAQVNQSEDALTIKDMVSKAKDAEEAKLKAADAKKDSQPTKA